MKIDLFYQDRKATKYSSEPILYVYLLFLKNQIVQLHVREVGSSCTHLYMIYQLLIGLKQLLTGLSLLTRLNLLIGTQDTIHYSQTPNRVNILNWILYIENHLVVSIPIEVFPWLGFPQLTKYSVMSSLYGCLVIVFNIICLLSYVYGKAINNIQFYAKVCIILIHSPPLSIIYFSQDLANAF